MSIFSIDMGGLINERHCCDNSQQGISEKKRWAPTNGRRFNPCLVGTEDFVRISMDANLLDCLGRRRYFPSRGHFLAIAEGNLIIWNAFAVSSPTTTTIWLLFVTFQMPASTGQARGHRNLVSTSSFWISSWAMSAYHPVRPLRDERIVVPGMSIGRGCPGAY